ncbi:MAG: TolC family protein [Deltaproteobacteria bacterium]|nr:TolC family protein [Deltaproteobacteria bacterium]
MPINYAGTIIRASLVILLALVLSLNSAAGPAWSGEMTAPPGISKTTVIAEPQTTKPDGEEKGKITLEESIKLALEQSTNIITAVQEISAKYYQKKQTFTAFLPSFKTGYSYTRLSDTPVTTMGGLLPISLPTAPQDNYNFFVSVTEPVFTGFSRLTAYEISELNLDVANVQLQTARLTLILSVKQAYYTILRSVKAIEVAESSVQALASHAKVAKDFYDVGMIPENDWLRSEVELANAQQDLVRARNDFESSCAFFNTILRRDISIPVSVYDILTYTPCEKALDKYFATARTTRPELKEMKLRINLSEKDIKLTKSEYYPSLSVAYTYNKLGENPTMDEYNYGKSDTWTVAAMLNWTFWEWNRTNYKVQEKNTGLKKAEQLLIQTRDQVDLDVKRSYLDLITAEKNIFVGEKSIQQAKEAYRMAEQRYVEQVTTSTEVLDAQNLLVKAQNYYYNALYAYNLAKAGLTKAIGQDDGPVKTALEKVVDYGYLPAANQPFIHP